MAANGMTYDVVVLGGGAAGMMSAIEAGKRGRKVLLLDHAEKGAATSQMSAPRQKTS